MQNKKGFTLIELLVVVLIIGILASVALPQYEKAVEKSRAAEAMQLLKYMHGQGQLCELANGADGCASMASNEELNIEMPSGMNCYNDGEEEFCCNKSWCYSNRSLGWGDIWASSSPKTPVAARVNNGDPDGDMNIKYFLEMEDTGKIWCFDGEEEWCKMFKGNGKPIY